MNHLCFLMILMLTFLFSPELYGAGEEISCDGSMNLLWLFAMLLLICLALRRDAKLRQEIRARRHSEKAFIAECKEMEKKREKAFSRLRAVFDTVPGYISVTDADYRLLDMNQQLREDCGLGNDENIIGKKCYEVLRRRSEPCDDCAVPGVITEGKVVSRICTPGKNAEKICRKVYAAPIKDADGNISSVIECAVDISDLMAMEQKLKTAKEAAECADRAKSEFLGRISHEFRTPMNAILGLSSILLQTRLSAQQQEHIRSIQSSADSLMHIIEDVLDFSKIETGRMQIKSEVFHPHEILEKTARYGRKRAKGKEIDFRLETAEELPLRLVGDAFRLHRILCNLTDNAVKFTEKGEIVLRAGPPEMLPAGQMKIRFSVQDTGIGIEPSLLSSLFSSFRMGDESLTRKHGGIGLGLTVAKSLAEMMYGELRAESERGRGSIFYLSAVFGQVGEDSLQQGKYGKIPDAPFTWSRKTEEVIPHMQNHDTQDNKTQSRKMQDSDMPLRALRSAKILVAEDNGINQLVIRTLLEGRGIQAEIVNNGREALEAVQHSSYDLLLMDMQMPEMDGYEAAQEIRKWETRMGIHRSGEQEVPQASADPGAEDSCRISDPIPIIAMTAHVMPGEEEKCRLAGMDDYLSKPLDADKLFSVLAAHIPQNLRSFCNPPSPIPVPADDPDDPDDPDHPDHPAENTMPKLPGIDTDFGLRQLGGNIPLYQKLLWAFVREYADSPARFREALEKKDREYAMQLAHTVKGVAGNMGAKDLYRVSGELEDVIRKEKTEMYPEKIREYEKFLHIIRKSVRQMSEEEKKKIPAKKKKSGEEKQDKVRTLLTELRELLEDGDSEAAECLEELKPFLQSSDTNVLLPAMEEQIFNFDFEEALRTLDKIVQIQNDQ
ncbi:MAG: response regulator [Desulfococcaceae bacterium]|nr:response regulator [Desulfococcaceae bacterium]